MTAPDEALAGPSPGGITRRWPLLVAMTAIAVAVALIVTETTWTERWEADALVRIGKPSGLTDNFTDPAYVDRILNTSEQIAAGDPVEEQASEEAGLATGDSDGEVNEISVEVERETELLRISVTRGDPEEAEALLTAMVEQAGSEIERVYGDNIAYTPIISNEAEEVQPPYVVRGLAAGAAGLLLGLALAAFVEQRNRSITRRR